MGALELRGRPRTGERDFGGFGGLDNVNDEPGFLTTTLTSRIRCSTAA